MCYSSFICGLSPGSSELCAKEPWSRNYSLLLPRHSSIKGLKEKEK